MLDSAGYLLGLRMRQCGRNLCGSFAGPGATLTPFVLQRCMLFQAQRNSDFIVSFARMSAFQGFCTLTPWLPWHCRS